MEWKGWNGMEWNEITTTQIQTQTHTHTNNINRSKSERSDVRICHRVATEAELETEHNTTTTKQKLHEQIIDNGINVNVE